MRQSRFSHTLLLTLALAATACARNERAATAATTNAPPTVAVAPTTDTTAETTTDAASDQSDRRQSPATTIQSFTTVEGADLNARLAAAAQRARGRQTPYWSAYAFDVRPGVAVDPAIHEFHGSMNTIGDTSVFVGTTAAGVTVETRDLAVFVLRGAGSDQVTRLEVYNLERRREYSGYPVYWLGRANNEESINYLRGLSESAPAGLLAERAVLALALHDDARVAPALKNFVRTSSNQRVRAAAVHWLGEGGGEHQFLSDIVRNETEDKRLRRQAAHAVGASRDAAALAAVQSLYQTVADREVHRSLVHAAADNQDRAAAFAFVLRAAKSDPDRDTRRAAIHQLGEFGEQALDELMKLYASETDGDVKRAALHALAETNSPRAQAKILEIARTDPSPELRRNAIRQLGERGEAAVTDLIALYDAERAPDVRRTVLQTLAETKSQRAEEKLFAVARADDNTDARRQAIRLLGERAGRRALELLQQTAESADGNTEVQMQAVRAIAERPADEAVPLLIRIAKTHANQQVRKQAIRLLGESGDPRAIEYFREVLTK
jgi:HEAT repeat protein